MKPTVKNFTYIQCFRFPCIIDCPDGTEIDLDTYFNPTIRFLNEEKTKKSCCFRGRPLEGEISDKLNMFLVETDNVDEATLKATGKVTELTNWEVKILCFLLIL